MTEPEGSDRQLVDYPAGKRGPGNLQEPGIDLKVIRVLHLNLTRVREPDYGLWLGWFPVFGLLFLSVSNCF